MTDRAAIALAALAWLGAVLGLRTGLGPPTVVAAVAVVVALGLRRPPLLLAVIALLTSGRAVDDARSLSPPPTGDMTAWATLLSDPEVRDGGAVRVEVRVGTRHLLATARGESGARLQRRSAGQQVLIVGRTGRSPPGSHWLERRHIVGQLAIDDVRADAPGSLIVRVANGVRDLLARSAEALPAQQRGLYLGFVLGDDRGQPVEIVDDFRGSGLSHLLAVSGQNVAFVLAFASPVLRRCGLRARWSATIGVIGLFALITRFEPSVLRASVMAALAATASMLGREASGLRVLSLAVAALLVLDPFLVDSAGFQLSVAASAAILVVSHRLAARLPGPRPLAEAVAVSAAAQIGVAPILVATFGGAPVSGLLANVLAAPAAGPVMVWGVAAGLAGGALGPGIATVLHLPTRVLIWWIAVVAERGARWPLGQLRGGEVVVVLVGVACVVALRRSGKASGAALVIAGLLAPAAAQAATPPVLVALDGASLWRAGGATVLVVGGRAHADTVLTGLREAGVDRIDLVVVTVSSRDAIVDVVATRTLVRAVVRPGDVDVPAVVQCGGLEVLLEPSADGVTAIVRAVGARAPPAQPSA